MFKFENWLKNVVGVDNWVERTELVNMKGDCFTRSAHIQNGIRISHKRLGFLHTVVRGVKIFSRDISDSDLHL